MYLGSSNLLIFWGRGITPECIGTPPPPRGSMVVHSIVEHPNQEGDTYCRARTSGLMAERVHGRDIQSIVTDH